MTYYIKFEGQFESPDDYRALHNSQYEWILSVWICHRNELSDQHHPCMGSKVIGLTFVGTMKFKFWNIARTIYESLKRLVMYFIVAYCGCVGLIAALAEAGIISMRERSEGNHKY